MQLVNSKTKHCQHHNGCLYDATKQALKQIKYGAIMVGILQALKSLRAILKGKQYLKGSFNKDLLSILVFLCTSTFTLRVVRCLLRRLRDKEDGLNPLLAGLAFGYVGTQTLNKGYWHILLMFVASRIWGAFYRFLIQLKFLDQKNSKLHFYLMFVFANAVNSTGYFLEPDVLKPDMFNLYDRMAMLTSNEKKWLGSSYTYTLRKLVGKGAEIPNDILKTKMIKFAKG